MRNTAQKPLLMIGIPTRGMHSHWFSQSLAGMIFPSNFSLVQMYVPYMEVGKARNLIVHKAIEMGAKYLFFIDEDVIAPANGVKTLLHHMQMHPEWSFVSGLYATKSYPPEPLIYKEWAQGAFYDWQPGDMVKVLFTGMGFSIIRVEDLNLLSPEIYVDRDPNNGMDIKVKEFFKTGEGAEFVKGSAFKFGHTEDAWLFKQFEEKGLEAYVDTGVICDHFDDKNSVFFRPPLKGKPDVWNCKPLVLNVGGGDSYDPYEVNVDMIDDPRVTVKRDVRDLPDDWTDKFDVVKSSHVLEHFDFGETATTLAEWIRVLKPGGKFQIIVPDIEAYSADILGKKEGNGKGYLDVFILGGLYGDQGHEFWRQDPYGGTHGNRFIKSSFENNHHRTGFTARSLGGYLKQAGLEIKQIRQADYQIYMEAQKPEAPAEEQAEIENKEKDVSSDGG